MRHLFGFLAMLCLSAVLFVSNAAAAVLAFAVPRSVDPRAYLALSSAPRSIFDTRRMGLA